MGERVFAMPDLGEGLDDGTIVAWLVAEGDAVTLNQPLVEVETAKATVEIPSPFAGRVMRLHGTVDGTITVGAPLVTFDVDLTGEIAPTPERERPETPGKVAATPIVRRLAKDLGVDLRLVRATGPDGRITSDDVRAAATGEGNAARVGDGAEPEEADSGLTRMPVTAARKAIAENLERQWSIPQVTTFRTVDCTELEAFRAELGVSPLPVVVAALAAIVPAHPLVNAAWAADAILLSSTINVGLAADTERGLVVPVLRDAGPKGIGELSTEVRRLAEAARGGTVAMRELSGATIAVSNTGSYGSEAGTPILSPGTAVTIALGVIAPRALVVDGAIEVRAAATLSLTFDHRVLDGAAAGRALSDIVDLLQSPERLRDLPR